MTDKRCYFIRIKLISKGRVEAAFCSSVFMFDFLHARFMINMIILMLFTGCLSVPDDTPPDIIRGLEGFWSFDNDEGDLIKDDSGSDRNGTAYNVIHGTGVAGSSVLFNSSDAKIVIPSAAGTPPEEISRLETGSISIWFRFQSLGAQILPVLYFGENDIGTPHNSLIIEVGHGGGNDPLNKRLYFTIVNRRFCFDSGFNLTENEWYHFVAVVSAAGNTGYLNGAELTGRRYNLGSSSSYTDFFSDVPVDEILSIGYGRYGQEDPFYTFNGEIDEVRIYNRALTAEEVLLLYHLK